MSAHTTDAPPIIDVWYGPCQRFGHAGLPQHYINILGNVRPAAPNGPPIHSLRWGLTDRPFTPLNLGPSAFRLARPGDFNIEIEAACLAPGEHTVHLAVNDDAGRETRIDARFMYIPVRQLPARRVVDWSAACRIDDLAQVVDGHWRLTPHGVRPTVMHYDRLILTGDMDWTDYRVDVPVTLHGVNPSPGIYRWPSFGPLLGVILRFAGHVDWHDMYPRRGWKPFGIIGGYRYLAQQEAWSYSMMAGDGSWPITDVARAAAEPMALDRTHIFALDVRSRPGTTSLYRMKIWPIDTAEPSAWQHEVEGAPGELAAGSIGLLAHHCDATFGNLRVQPGDPASHL